MKLENF